MSQVFTNPAIHGLGTIIEENMSPREALVATGLDWQVEMIKGVQSVTEDGRMFEGDRETSCGRCDNMKILGVHKSRYRPLQNEQLFDIAYALGGKVQVETAGSFDEGRRVFLLLKGDTFEMQNREKCITYLALTNSHDGSTKFAAVPTTLRVTSNTTLSLLFSRSKGSRIYTIRHDGSMNDKVADLTHKLQTFRDDADAWYQQAVSLQKRQMTKDEMATFWGVLYEKVLKKGRPVTDEEKAAAELVLSGWQNTMEKDMAAQGLTEPDLWLAANAVATDFQTSTPLRRVGDWETKRIEKNWFGDTADKTATVFQEALAILG